MVVISLPEGIYIYKIGLAQIVRGTRKMGEQQSTRCPSSDTRWVLLIPPFTAHPVVSTDEGGTRER
jgi:hypothetical protein